MLSKDVYNIRKEYPLWMKIEISKTRIKQWVDYYGEEGVYISFSGGKDSTVLLHLVRSLYPNIPGVFSNTGLEFPEIIRFVKTFENIEIIRPETTFKKVINEYGYPVATKAVSSCVRLARKNIADGKNTLRVRQIRGLEKGSKFNKGHWEYLLDAPFLISEQCCNLLKKEPMHKYEKRTNRVPFVGARAGESMERSSTYLQHGCNAFDSKKPLSKPLSFWTDQDIYQYIIENNISICSVYGEIYKGIDDKYHTTGESRTGCMWCPLRRTS